jgi:hypothetical protein
MPGWEGRCCAPIYPAAQLPAGPGSRTAYVYAATARERAQEPQEAALGVRAGGPLDRVACATDLQRS